MSKKLYDIQGVPIRVGSLVACVGPTTLGRLQRGRVTSIGYAFKSVGPIFVKDLNGVSVHDVHPHNCVVLEEPVWPNS